MVVVVVVVVVVEVVDDDIGPDVVVDVDVVVVGANVVEVVLVAQHSDKSLPSKPQGLLIEARRYLRRLLVTPCLMMASSTGLQSPEEMN